MTPFETLIQELSLSMDVALQPDSHLSCLINFSAADLSVQIDLDTDADRILLGSQLGRINPGSYRQRIFTQALKTNGLSQIPRGTLAFSEKNDTLVLFQYLHLNKLNGEKLYQFLQLFVEHARIWKEALATGDIPVIQEESAQRGSGMFGLRK